MTATSSQLPRDFDIEVARNVVPGYQNIRIVGINPTVGNTFEDLWDEGGTFSPPTAGETWEVVSDSANDTSAGTGAKAVMISGLDDNFTKVTEVVPLDGTTPVVTIRTDWFRITEVNVTVSGSSQSNEGSITIRVSGGGLTRSLIRPGLSNTFNGFFTVPVGKVLFIKSSQVVIPKNQDVITRNKFKAFGSNTFLTGGDSSIYQNTNSTFLTSVAVLPEKTDLVSTAKSTNSSVSVALLIQAKLVDDAGANLPLITF